MRGFPKYLNSKQDYQNCLTDYPEETKSELQRLLDSRFVWVDTELLANDAAGTTDATHRVVNSDEGKIQQELVEDSNSELLRLGFTVQEAEDIING